MANVFISYERSAEALVRKVHDALLTAGHTVWTDAELPPHRAYADVIEERLAAADAVLVLWSAAAARSQWVRAEAEHARERGKLVQLTLDGALPPMPFNQIQCAQLQGWTGDRNAPGWRKVLSSLDQISAAERPMPEPPSAAPAATRLRAFSLRPAWIVAAATAAVLAGIVAAVLLLERSNAPSAGGRIAILPFEALTDTPEAHTAAKVLGDQIFSTLNSNEIPAVSEEDAVSLRGPDAAARMKTLGVSLVFGGTVQDDGKTIDIKVHLDDPAHHATLWTGAAQGSSAEAATLQGQLAKTVADVLACSNRALKPNGLSDPDLFSRYLRACDLFVNSTDSAASIFQLISNLRTVIKGAPNFVAARTDLAKFEGFLAPNMPPDTAATMRHDAGKLADEALKLQPNAPDAYLAKEMILPPTAWAAREAMLRKGVAADPDWPHTNGFLAFLLQETGRVQEAKIYGAKAAAADLQIDWRTEGAWIACDAQDFEPSTSNLQDMFKNEPTNYDAKTSLRRCLMDAHRFADARALDPPSLPADATTSFASLRLSLFKALESKSSADRDPARQAALNFAKLGDSKLDYATQTLSMLGDLDDAFALAEHVTPGYPSNDTMINFLFAPPTEAMRRDPRFIKLAARLKLTPFWIASGKWPDFCAEPDLPYNCRAEISKVSSP